MGKEPGGRFGKVLLAGSGKISGDVECDEFSVPGAGKVEDGGLTVHGSISCQGACKVEGPVRAEGLVVHGAFSTESGCEIRADASVHGSLKTEGSCVIGGLAEIKGAVSTEQDFQGKTVRVSGVLKSEAGMRAEEFDVSGVLKAEGDVQAERFRAEGPVTIDGELNADSVELQLVGESMIETIVGGSVQVRALREGSGSQRAGFRLHLDLSQPFLGLRKLDRSGGSNPPHLAAELIEADEISLECTDCETVRGVNVHIGPGCEIGRVEYSGSLSTDANCTVREKVKI